MTVFIVPLPHSKTSYNRSSNSRTIYMAAVITYKLFWMNNQRFNLIKKISILTNQALFIWTNYAFPIDEELRKICTTKTAQFKVFYFVVTPIQKIEIKYIDPTHEVMNRHFCSKKKKNSSQVITSLKVQWYL